MRYCISSLLRTISMQRVTVIAKVLIVFGLALCQSMAYGVGAAGHWKPTIVIGSPISDSQLDGEIGIEWEDAVRSTVRFGGPGYRKEYRLSIYMKYDLTYLYIAVVRNGSLLGGAATLWITLDANRDGRVYRNGDDAVMIPNTDGKLVDNIDYAYYEYKKAPKRDTAFGGTDDKKGASQASGGKYVYELKIPMASGDCGSLGNDIALLPGDKLATTFGLMNNFIEIPSEKGDQRLERPTSNPCQHLDALAGKECDAVGTNKTCTYTIRLTNPGGSVVIIQGYVQVTCTESVTGRKYWRYQRIQQ